MDHRRGDQENVALIEAGEGIAEIDRRSRRDARRDRQHPRFARRAAQAPRRDRADCLLPLDPGHLAVGAGRRFHEPPDEPVVAEPLSMSDQQLDSSLGAQTARRIPAQRYREVLDTGSESGLRSGKSRMTL